MVELRYFTDSEFRKASPSCSLSDMDPGFMKMLDNARAFAGLSFVISSAFRTKDYELSKGRKATSSHCKGVAVDIRCSLSTRRIDVVRALLAAGFRRIGIHKNFIHVDADPDKVSAIWLY